MTRPTKFAWQLAAASATLALAAQAGAGAPAVPTDKPDVAHTTPWARAASKHNGSGIRLRYSVPGSLQAGQPASLQLQFSGVSADGASAALRAPDGATLVAEDGSRVDRIELPAGQVTTVSLRVVPTGDGLQTLDIFTSQAGRSSAQSIPLKVGSGTVKLQSPGKVTTTPSGEKVISVPAQTPAK